MKVWVLCSHHDRARAHARQQVLTRSRFLISRLSTLKAKDETTLGQAIRMLNNPLLVFANVINISSPKNIYSAKWKQDCECDCVALFCQGDDRFLACEPYESCCQRYEARLFDVNHHQQVT